MQQKGIDGKVSGRWTKEEHQRFMYAIMNFGKDWKKVEQYVRTRSGSQVRSHAQKFFNKLQKPSSQQDISQKQIKQISQSELDIERDLNNDVTPSTPHQLVSLIRRQSKQQGGKVDIGMFKKTLEEQSIQKQVKGNMPQSLRSSSYKSMSNLLSVYEQVNKNKQEQPRQDQSFLIALTKKYKKYFGKTYDFNQLIDIHSPLAQNKAPRKRSFTLPEGSSLSEDELDQKIQEIKKKIKTQHAETIKSTQSLKIPQEGILPLARLQTIQEHPKEDEDIVSCKILPQIQEPPQPQQKSE